METTTVGSSNRPVAKYRLGGVELTKWMNKKEVNGRTIDSYSFQIKKSYKDGEEWKEQKRQLQEIHIRKEREYLAYLEAMMSNKKENDNGKTYSD